LQRFSPFLQQRGSAHRRSADLPDAPYRDLFDAGRTPEEAADEAIENAMC
jgi:hypothetical protein